MNLTTILGRITGRTTKPITRIVCEYNYWVLRAAAVCAWHASQDSEAYLCTTSSPTLDSYSKCTVAGCERNVHIKK